MRLLSISALLLTTLLRAADPVATAWITSPAGNPGLAAILPDVQSVEVTEEFVTVRSAGISLRYLGPLESAPVPSESLRQFSFRIPRHPQPQSGRHAPLPAGVAGAFLNGMPIYNQFEALSWNGANIWHYDRIALNDDGTLVSTGRPRDALTHPATAGLIEQLIAIRAASPLIGFALDGYPVYGPWAIVNGELRRLRSGYQVRRIASRQTLPDGTELTPAQYGPVVDENNPAGTFAEDYEYVPNSGDLDECNGRFAVTREFPSGTYAYYLSTDESGRIAYPYLLGPVLFGKLPAKTQQRFTTIAKKRLELSADAATFSAGDPVRFRLRALDGTGTAIRHFEYIHEKPIHLLITSNDLTDFDHIHPELESDDSCQVTYSFPHQGKYRLWADFSLPGERPRLDTFDVTVSGPEPEPEPAVTIRERTLTFEPALPLRAAEDIPVMLRFTAPIDQLEPYLGAWAHVIVIGEDLQTFAHFHPQELATNPTHSHAAFGPPPREIQIVTNFPAAGQYKMWAQYQRAGQVVTETFDLQVSAALPRKASNVPIASEDLKVRVTQQGYEPAKLTIPANQPIDIAFTRDTTPNCGSEVVFPSLGIRRKLPPGETVTIHLPPQPSGEISFACGMGMFRGAMIAR